MQRGKMGSQTARFLAYICRKTGRIKKEGGILIKDMFLRENVEEILDYVEEGIQIIDHKGMIVYCNRFAAALDNVNREEAIGRHILEIYPSLSFDTSTLLKVIDSGTPIINAQQTFINYRGYKITTINSSIPIKAKGRVVGALEISRDITRYKKLSEKIIDLQAQINKSTNNDDQNKKTNKDKNNQRPTFTFMDIIGQSRDMLGLKSQALKAAQSSSPILIYGETGTGKELFVQSIHSSSSRRNKPFIAENCAAIPATLLEGILFGTVKGSFTGADNRPGLFEIANGGTLFLDEINSMPLALQPKLLRVLQDGSVRRVGDTKTTQVDVRIITALNKNPQESIKDKELREDLYYRLNVISLFIPPLRQRQEDLPHLISYFVNKYNKILGKNVLGISEEVRRAFYNHSWPGNVRELENTIEGSMNMIEGDIINLEHISSTLRDRFESKQDIKYDRPLRDILKDVEGQAIKRAMELCQGNISQAAKILDIPRQTLQYKLGKYGE